MNRTPRLELLLRARVVFLLGFLAALSLVAARAALGAFVDQCNYNAPTPSPYMTRDGSLTVAIVAMYEGYHWGGGRFYKSSFQPERRPSATIRP